MPTDEYLAVTPRYHQTLKGTSAACVQGVSTSVRRWWRKMSASQYATEHPAGLHRSMVDHKLRRTSEVIGLIPGIRARAALKRVGKRELHAEYPL